MAYIRGRAPGQGMVFAISVLNRVYNFMRACLKQGLNVAYVGYDCTIVVIKYDLYGIKQS